ncbi:DinB family protein [Crenobacter sp. SG2305]|uniref:DinB family protein n=1 Tax=Crenobacter oryzisoli TaxID=3056844 RepID=UPI0025AA9910|nr:DinB family protein [Crenobacter sp. SG2305]MDN0083692.1 DinB family protein [Crenobacter sp. SG2305]
MSVLLKSFQYKAWANKRTLEAIKRIDSNEFPSTISFVKQQLNHMIIVEELFKARLMGDETPHKATNTTTLPSIGELERRIETSDAWYHSYASQLQDQHEELVTFQFVDGLQGSMSRAEILFHIINHGTYHRGAIGHALDLCSVAHPADTYTVFIHAAEPDRRLAR